MLSLRIHQFTDRVLQSISKEAQRQRHYWKNMDCSVLQPPAAVRGMEKLERSDFKKVVMVPRLHVCEDKANNVLPLVRKLLLKMERLRPVRVVEASQNTSPDIAAFKEILLHPEPVKAWESLPTSELENLGMDASNFSFAELELGYDNWRTDEIFKGVLPLEQEGLTSYSRIGHIVHLNLRDHLLPYKSLIGEVLCDKVSGCRTVVNKAATIDNTYRNFHMELICGEPDYQVETKENGVTFEFDFSRVYWNPRLCTEHERIVQILRPGDVLYDVFAGVGPFSVPAAKKRCYVLANDLNPESYRWLQHNCKRNKCLTHAQLFNKDGRDFLLEDVKSDLLKRWRAEKSLTSQPSYKMHITMNLPAMAVEFLDVFYGLFEKEASELNFASPYFNFPTVHVYCFAKGDKKRELVQSLVEQNLGVHFMDTPPEINFVRNVAPNKDMFRVSFQLSKEILTATKKSQVELISRKRPAIDEAVEDSELDLQGGKIKCS